MPMMSDLSTLAANAVSANVASGKLYEAVPENSAVRLYATSSVADSRVSLSVGGQQVINDELLSGANRFPVIPDDLVTEVGGFAGEKIFLTFRAVTAASIKWLIALEPV